MRIPSQRRSWRAVALTAPLALCAFGCASYPEGAEGAPSLGAIDVALQLGDGKRLGEVRYEIVNHAYHKSGVVRVAESTRIAFAIGAVPAAQGYRITLEGDSAEGALACRGSSDFDIVAQQQTAVRVQLNCRADNASGSVRVRGESNLCPVLESLKVAPKVTVVSGSIQLSASGADADGDPGQLSYAWSSTLGTLHVDGSEATLVCDEPGKGTLYVTLSDGDCADTRSAEVSCREDDGHLLDAGRPHPDAASADEPGGDGDQGRAPAGGSHAWPSTREVATLDSVAAFDGGLSGLAFQRASRTTAASLWAVSDTASRLYRLTWTGSGWVNEAAWQGGKRLRYPGGVGSPDAEGVSFGADASSVYVVAERDLDAPNVSRPSVLRYDASAAGDTLSAVREWNLAQDLPRVAADLGLEAIAFVPDAALLRAGFFDERLQKVYEPAQYADHAGGVFFVGLEATGAVFAYALNHSAGSFARIATFDSGFPAVVGLEYDAETATLWATCDDACGNLAAAFRVAQGRFTKAAQFSRPPSLPDTSQEGIAVASAAWCVNGEKPFFWVDASDSNGHSLRSAMIDCDAPQSQ